MLFNSYTFALFLGIVYALYCLFWKRFRVQNLLLLVASYVFYGWWDVRFLFLIILSTVVDYLCSIRIDRSMVALNLRCKAYLALLGSYFLFVLLPWHAIRFVFQWPFVECSQASVLHLPSWAQIRLRARSEPLTAPSLKPLTA